MDTAETLIALTRQLIAINSITGTKDSDGNYNENNVADFLISYCKDHAIPYEIVTTPDGRKCVFMWKKGTTKKTIVFLAHHDTVGIEDYAGLPALDPDALATIENNPKYLYGRGSGDMKAGVAIGLDLMRALQTETLQTNVLFISAPDEENASAGVLAACKKLQELKQTEGLDYLGLINVDCNLEDESSNIKNAVAGGTVGKLLPSFFVVGKAAHVSDPFSGIGSNAIASAILSEFDLQVTYSDQSSVTNDVTPPPACLKMIDLKHEYNVQLPLKSFLYFNYLTFTETPAAVLEKMRAVAMTGLTNALAANTEKYTGYMQRLKKSAEERAWTTNPKVYSYAEVYQKALGKKSDLDTEISTLISKAGEMDERELNAQIVDLVASYAGIESPYVVFFFSPPFYPGSYNSEAPFVKTFIETLTQFGKDEQVTYKISPISEGISDMNYMQIDKNALSDFQQYNANNPAANFKAGLDFTVLADVSMPITNVGPYAFNPHQEGEKVEIAYTFSVLPRLYRSLIKAYQKFS